MRIMMGKCKRLFRPSFLLLLLIPLAASMLLGSFLEKQQEELIIPIGIVDFDHSDFSKEILKKMKNQEMVVVHEISSEEGSKLLERNEVDSVFVIKPRFQESLLKEEERRQSSFGHRLVQWHLELYRKSWQVRLRKSRAQSKHPIKFSNYMKETISLMSLFGRMLTIIPLCNGSRSRS